MKNTIKVFGFIALAVIIGFSMVACGGGDDDDGGGGVSVPSQLVGEWNSSDGQGSIAIKSDGEINSLRYKLVFFILPSSTLGPTSGTIVFGYQSELIGPSGSFSYNISGNTMTISNSDYYDFPNGTYTRGSGGNNPQTATYTGTASGTTYTLKINGDAYELTAGTKKSAGTVNNVSGGVLTLKPSNAATTFTATVSGTSLTALNGTITWTDNSTASAPGTFTGGSQGGGQNENDARLIGKWEWQKVMSSGTWYNLPYASVNTGGYSFTSNSFTSYLNGSIAFSFQGTYSKNNTIYNQNGQAGYTYSINGNTLTANDADGSSGVIANKVTKFSWE